MRKRVLRTCLGNYLTKHKEMIPLFLLMLLTNSLAYRCQTCNNLYKVRQEITTNGSFTTVKAIEIRQALQLGYATSVYLGEEALSHFRFRTFFESVIFYDVASAIEYMNKITIDYLQSNTSLPISNVTQNFTSYYVNCAT